MNSLVIQVFIVAIGLATAVVIVAITMLTTKKNQKEPTNPEAGLCDLFLVFAPSLKVINKVDIENLDELLKGLAPIYPIAKPILNLEEKILALNATL